MTEASFFTIGLYQTIGLRNNRSYVYTEAKAYAFRIRLKLRDFMSQILHLIGFSWTGTMWINKSLWILNLLSQILHLNIFRQELKQCVYSNFFKFGITNAALEWILYFMNLKKFVFNWLQIGHFFQYFSSFDFKILVFLVTKRQN